ncbi:MULTISPECIES: hypothetical protein [unclassified Spirosoma]|uniref:hypothetical protein n=1 Tax=unclassified Spirosoma TaxID=2621999 RepID=UPI0009648F44|nr:MULTISPECIES: hypothetical protein [unclassified Spirosoma]MBN8824458.1 hypothetical protein [Spirosoma sp.]OJW70079.1 MAG: hypothetical protein BGO59_25735 [Spirosoma sp. 48-14]
MLNAFRPLVGLRGVDNSASSWVNDLAGLSTELVGDLALPSDLLDGDNSPESAVWESVHRNACERLQNEVLLQLSENYDFQPVIMRTLEPSRKRPFVTSSMQDGVFLATLVTIPYTPNATINLRSLTVSVPVLPGNQRVTASVRVYDLDAQSQLYAAPHEFDAGINTIELNETYRTVLMEPLQLVVMVDASHLPLHALNVCWNACDNDCALIEGRRTINPANLAGTLLDEEIYIALDIEVTRSLDKLLPRYAKDMQAAYCYLCGSLLMTEKLATPNLSVFTLSNAVFTERMESQLSTDFKRALRPVMRRMSNDLLKKEALTVPTATPSEVTYISGSYV